MSLISRLHRTTGVVPASPGIPPPPRARRRAARAVMAVAIVVAAAGCGDLVLDDKPRIIDSSNVPEALLGPTTTAPTDPAPAGQGVDAELFLYLTTTSDEFLVPCMVLTAAGGSVEARARAVLERLIRLDPLTGAECPGNLTNAVPSNLVVLGAQLRVEASGNVLELNLAREGIRAIESTQQRRAIAQLVFTATAVPGVTSVRFLGDGEPISVPLEDRTADPGEIVRPSDFPKLVASLDRLNELFTQPTTPLQEQEPPVL